MTPRGLLNRFLPFAISFAVTSVFFVNLCGWLFSCGCASLWAGADAACNVHLPHEPHCPFCRHGVAAYAGVFTLVSLPQLVVSVWVDKPLRRRVIACLILFPATLFVIGLIMGWYDGYWQHASTEAPKMGGIWPTPDTAHGSNP